MADISKNSQVTLEEITILGQISRFQKKQGMPFGILHYFYQYAFITDIDFLI